MLKKLKFRLLKVVGLGVDVLCSYCGLDDIHTFINSQVKFISAHQEEIQYARAVIVKIMGSSKDKHGKLIALLIFSASSNSNCIPYQN